jgi:hypothetical protein
VIPDALDLLVFVDPADPLLDPDPLREPDFPLLADPLLDPDPLLDLLLCRDPLPSVLVL